MKRYLNREVLAFVSIDEWEHEAEVFVRDITDHNGRITCILGGKIVDVHCNKDVHPSKAGLWFTNEFVSRETINIAKRARRHR